MSKKSRRKRQKLESGGKSQVAAGPSADLTRLFTFVAVMVLFFASGFSSLVYQVVWTRMLVLVFGATTFATSTSLAIFMGGLALGSAVAGRFCDKSRHPLIWYGVLEAVIGVWALLTPMMFAQATPVYKAVWQATHASMLELSLLRFVVTALILIVPTACMGATLPLLSRFVSTSLDTVGSRVGALYSVNTLGAVAGAVTAGFFLLPSYGLAATIDVGAAINLLLLLTVILMSRLLGDKSVLPPGAPLSTSDEPSKPSPLSFRVKLATVVFAISGAIAMIYEVCWTRTLLMVIGSSTYAFTVMLTAFLLGIFIGSFVCSRRIDRAKDPLAWFAIAQLSIGVLTLVSMRLFNQVPYLNIVLNSLSTCNPDATMMVRFALAGLVLSPITVCLGAIFPIVVKACTSELSAVGRSVGFLYSANTLGAIIGAFLAGFVCLPLWGAEPTLIAGAVLNTALGLLLLFATGNFSIQLQVGCSLVSVALVTVLLLSTQVWDRNVLLNAQSLRRRLSNSGYRLTTFEDWRNLLNKQCQVRFWADGTCSNVGVVYHNASKVNSLITNGHIDASDDDDTQVQAMLSAIPLLLKPDTKEMAIVGWGCGQTVGVATLFDVNSIDAIELEPKVIEASRLFHHMNFKPEQDKRVHIIYNDGRNYLLASDKKYDLIVSEPSNPWQAGVCNLFSKEYFAICKSRLTDSGMLAIWMQTAEVPPASLSGVIAALKSEFDNVLAFSPKEGNLILIASAQPLVVDYGKIQDEIKLHSFRKRALSACGMNDASDLLGLLVVASDGLQRLVATFINSDDHNRLEFDVGKTYEDKIFVHENAMMLLALASDPWKFVDFGKMNERQKAEAMSAVAQVARNNAFSENALKWAYRSQSVYPNSKAYGLLGEISMDSRNVNVAEVLFKKALAIDPKNAKLLAMHGNSLVALNRRNEARKELEASLQLDPADKSTAISLANSYSVQLLGPPVTNDAQDASARQAAETVLKLLQGLPDDEAIVQKEPQVCLLAAQANLKIGHLDRAEKLIHQYLEHAPKKDEDVGRTMLKMIKSYRADN